jgi:hypothetical protein
LDAQKGQKGDVVNILIKFEFSERLLGDSPKVECSPGQPAEFTYSTTMHVAADDPLAIDDLACKPLICKKT